jgi:hypothetical protein
MRRKIKSTSEKDGLYWETLAGSAEEERALRPILI